MVEKRNEALTQCTDCQQSIGNLPHDCPGSVLDRLNQAERKIEELNSIVKSMVRVVAYSLRDIPVGRSHNSNSDKPPPPSGP